MPNTLAHIGLQVPLTKLGFQKVPMQWILLGCIIPDIPWIIQRILRLIPLIDPVELRLYATVQASFFSCCILSLVFALLTRKTGFIFLILSVNSLFHLLLDACQIKWGNGVHLLAPFSWHLTNFGFFWPEDMTTVIITAMGVAALIFYWPGAVRKKLFLQKPGGVKTLLLITFTIGYLTVPFLLVRDAYNADVHFSKTIVNKQDQAGKPVEIDRGRYNSTTQTIRNYANRALPINNPPKVDSGSLSIKGIFDRKNSITITEFHGHNGYRNYPSYAGLFFILLIWLHSIFANVDKVRK
jgi:hypothetical protein